MYINLSTNEMIAFGQKLFHIDLDIGYYMSFKSLNFQYIVTFIYLIVKNIALYIFTKSENSDSNIRFYLLVFTIFQI